MKQTIVTLPGRVVWTDKDDITVRVETRVWAGELHCRRVHLTDAEADALGKGFVDVAVMIAEEHPNTRALGEGE